MELFKGIRLPLFILLTAGVTAAFLLPYFAIDETRYLTVAWEMKLNHSIVPLLNGSPYSDKPPLLFALINLDWFLFGVNEKTLRFIPVLFSLLNIIMTYRIALVMWNDKKTARYAAAVLSSVLIYLAWSTLIMFDIVLSSFVLVGIYGLLSAKGNNVKKSLILISISVGGGLLTKGPVVFVYILPSGFLYFLWKSENGPGTKRWFLMILFSVIAGAAIALLWAVPAALKGGEEYRNAIFWGQTTGRVLSSFAHQRPIWWYLPLLPVLILPWILVKPAWYGFSLVKHDKSYRFLVIWVLSTITIFSLVSGKQLYYLVPVLPGISLLIGKNIVTFGTKVREYKNLHYPAALFYITLGILISVTPFIRIGDNPAGKYTTLSIILAVTLTCIGCIIFIVKPLSLDRLIKTVSLSSLAFFISVVFAGSNKLFSIYDVTDFARVLGEKQKQGYNIVNFGKYYGQYQFIGRLTEPLTVIKDKKGVSEYAETHKKVLLITYEKPEENIDNSDVLYQQLIRGKKAVLWGKNGIRNFLDK